METYNIHRYNSVGRPRACLALSPSFTLIAYTFEVRFFTLVTGVGSVYSYMHTYIIRNIYI